MIFQSRNPYNTNNFSLNHVIPKPTLCSCKGTTTVAVEFKLHVTVNRTVEYLKAHEDENDEIDLIIEKALEERKLFDELGTCDGIFFIKSGSRAMIEYFVRYYFDTTYTDSKEDWGLCREYDEYVTSEMVCQEIKKYIIEHNLTSLILDVEGVDEKEIE